MYDYFADIPFKPADILLPQNCDLGLWSVVACDQYTSQPEYWSRVENRVGANPSSLRLILPESRLEGANVEQEIAAINDAMGAYLEENRFRTLERALIYVERTLHSGLVRRGLIGRIDLEAYDYRPGSTSQIRCTEGTVLSRVPPRMEVRKRAPIELPHVLLLADDPQRAVIEPLSQETDRMERLYDFELMEEGGHLRGWLLNQEQQCRVAQAIGALAKSPLFAVGDGNHSLAAAKACWEQCRAEAGDCDPRRYALVELENIYDPALVFEPIHRVVFGVEPEALLEDVLRFYPEAYRGRGEGHVLSFAHGAVQACITVPNPTEPLEIGTLQNFLDHYMEQHNQVGVDYVHGDDVALHLAESPDCVAFLLPAMEKQDLFPAVVQRGALPRKTFSMGEACDKRFYLEARKLRD